MKKFYPLLSILTILPTVAITLLHQKKIKDFMPDKKDTNESFIHNTDLILNPPDLETMVLDGDGEDDGDKFGNNGRDLLIMPLWPTL